MILVLSNWIKLNLHLYLKIYSVLLLNMLRAKRCCFCISLKIACIALGVFEIVASIYFFTRIVYNGRDNKTVDPSSNLYFFELDQYENGIAYGCCASISQLFSSTLWLLGIYWVNEKHYSNRFRMQMMFKILIQK